MNDMNTRQEKRNVYFYKTFYALQMKLRKIILHCKKRDRIAYHFCSFISNPVQLWNAPRWGPFSRHLIFKLSKKLNWTLGFKIFWRLTKCPIIFLMCWKICWSWFYIQVCVCVCVRVCVCVCKNEWMHPCTPPYIHKTGNFAQVLQFPIWKRGETYIHTHTYTCARKTHIHM